MDSHQTLWVTQTYTAASPAQRGSILPVQITLDLDLCLVAYSPYQLVGDGLRGALIGWTSVWEFCLLLCKAAVGPHACLVGQLPGTHPLYTHGHTAPGFPLPSPEPSACVHTDGRALNTLFPPAPSFLEMPSVTILKKHRQTAVDSKAFLCTAEALLGLQPREAPSASPQQQSPQDPHLPALIAVGIWLLWKF